MNAFTLAFSRAAIIFAPTDMSILPSFLQDLGSRLAASSVIKELQGGQDDETAQKACFAGILEGLSQSDYGRAHGITQGMSPGDFSRLLPILTEQQALPLLRRMDRGAENLLWPGNARALSCTPTFPWEPALNVPLSDHFLEQFVASWRKLLLVMLGKGADASLLRTPPFCIDNGNTDEGPLGGPASLLCRFLEKQARPISCSYPELERKGGLFRCLSETPRQRLIIVGDPLWLSSLAPQPLSEEDTWWVLCLSPALADLRQQVRRILGPKTELFEALVCDSGIFAVRIGGGVPGMRLLTNTGLYYEFIPIEDFLSAPLGSLSSQAKPLGHQEVGREYAMLVSNTSGLIRHFTGERVRFVSTTPHRIEPCGRAAHSLKLGKLQLSEREVAENLTRCCDKRHWTIVHAHVAPLQAGKPVQESNHGHEWWVELKPGSHQTPTGPALAEGLEAELRENIPLYRTLRDQGHLGAPIVRLVIPGIFTRCLKDYGRADGLCRLPRCLPDRRMADVLANLARFCD